MAKLIIDNLSAQDIKDIHASGKKVSCLLENDGQVFIKVDKIKIKDKVKKEDGFRIADNFEIDFENYSDIVEDINGDIYIKIGTMDNRDRSGKVKKIEFTEFDAYIAKFGIDNIYLLSDIEFGDV